MNRQLRIVVPARPVLISRPTQAIVEPYMLDARKCIAYLTIEYKGIIPQELRHGIGNRVLVAMTAS